LYYLEDRGGKVLRKICMCLSTNLNSMISQKIGIFIHTHFIMPTGVWN